MSDLRGRHGKNFNGCYINLEGNDYALNQVLDDFDQTHGIEVFARSDTQDGGVLSLRCTAAQKTMVFQLAQKRGLKVAV